MLGPTSLARLLCCPKSLDDVNFRTQIVNELDTPLIQDSLLLALNAQLKADRLKELYDRTTSGMSCLIDTERANIVLRLYSGCISAAKTIALGTRNGPNSAELRLAAFSKIDSIAQINAVFAAGVETAPAFETLRNEPISFDGVAERSVVRRFANLQTQIVRVSQCWLFRKMSLLLFCSRLRAHYLSPNPRALLCSSCHQIRQL